MFIPMNPATPAAAAEVGLQNGLTLAFRADDEPYGRDRPEKHRHNDRHDHTDDRDRGVLTLEVRLGPLLDRCGDLLHFGVAGRC
jgi:hypothetical protein